jgi:hypothetical protein
VGELQLSTWSFNTGALEAWRHLGFAPQATRFAVDRRRLKGQVGPLPNMRINLSHPTVAVVTWSRSPRGLFAVR